jgi:xanthine dehydrogenase accessory factor
MTEVAAPLAVRRLVSFSEAVPDGTWTVEGTRAVRIAQAGEACAFWGESVIPIIVDPDNDARKEIRPDVIVDAILAKKNLGTTISDAPLVIGVGPGFDAGRDVHCVVETNRGHDLGRLIFAGQAAADTGIPGEIGGHTFRRVLRAPADGVFEADANIGALVSDAEIVGRVSGTPVRATLSGVLRGLIRSGTPVTRGLKIGDIDPRGEPSYCSTISDKSRAIGGTVLEAILMKFNTRS